MARILQLARTSAKWLLRPGAPFHDELDRGLLLGRFARKRTWQWLDRKTDRRKLMINIGGGHFFRRHWKVLDYPTQYYGFVPGVIDYPQDLTSGDRFPFADGEVSLYYSSHTLEHVPQECIAAVLAEIWRTLAPGGGIRLSVPDYDRAYDAMRARDEAALSIWSGNDVEERFLDSFASYFRGRVPAETLRAQADAMSRGELADYYTSRIPRESQRQTPGNHINWWSYDKLAGMLRDVGFGEVYRSQPQQSRFAEMRGVGRKTGFDSTYPEISLFVEAIK